VNDTGNTTLYFCVCKILSILVTSLLKVCKNCTDIHY